MAESSPREWITSGHAARLLDVTMPTVRDLAREGHLRTKRNERGWWVFPLEDVAKLAEHYRPHRRLQITGRLGKGKRMSEPHSASLHRGKFAQRMFLLFKEGKSLREIVIETGADPVLVRELWDEYRTSLEQGPQREEERRLEQQALRELEQARRDEAVARRQKLWLERERERAKRPVIVQVADATLLQQPRMPFSSGK